MPLEIVKGRVGRNLIGNPYRQHDAREGFGDHEKETRLESSSDPPTDQLRTKEMMLVPVARGTNGTVADEWIDMLGANDLLDTTA